MVLFHPQSCCWVVGFRSAAEDHEGAETPGLVWHQSRAWVCPERACSSPGRSGCFAGLDRVFLQVCVGLSHGCQPDVDPLLCRCWEEPFSPHQREKEEKVEIVAKGGEGASFLLLAFEVVFACSAGERN